MLLAIDPGPAESGFVVFSSLHGAVFDCGVMINEELLARRPHLMADQLAIEKIEARGMPVGQETLDTAVWVGRFAQAWYNRSSSKAKLIYRRDVKRYLCGRLNASDANIRQALIDLFPASGGGKTPQIGIKSNPGPLFRVKSHAWAALAVAVTATQYEGVRCATN